MFDKAKSLTVRREKTVLTDGERYWRVAIRMRIFSLVIAGVGMVASYFLQGEWYAAQHAGWISYVAPIIFDLTAYACVSVIQLPNTGWLLKALSWGGLVACAGWVMYACVAGSGNLASRVIHAAPTGIYLFMELVAGRVEAYAQRLRTVEAAQQKAETIRLEAEAAEDAKRRARSVNAALRAEIGARDGQIEELGVEIARLTAELSSRPKPRAKRPVTDLTVAELERTDYPQAPTTGAPVGVVPGDEARRRPRGPYKPDSEVVPRTLRRRAKAERERLAAQNVSE